MADDPKTGFDEVEEGPRPSSDEGNGSTGPETDGPPAERHPSVRALEERFGDAMRRHEVQAGDEHVVFVDPDRAREILRFLKEDPDQHYDYLADLTAVDYGGGRPIQVVYQLWSLPHRRALRVKCELPLSALEVDSVEPLWKAANWLEREVYDMFGVHFRGHPDLRRILMPDNYAEGHPLRKDFPLRGRFTREEQTRRALSLEPGDHYHPRYLDEGHPPQVVEGHGGGRPDRGAPRDRWSTVLPPMGMGPADSDAAEPGARDEELEGGGPEHQGNEQPLPGNSSEEPGNEGKHGAQGAEESDEPTETDPPSRGT